MTIQFQPGETNILCTDLETSLHFYRHVLNFALVEEDTGAMRLRCGGQHYLLLPFAAAKSPAEGYLSVATISFDLMVDDLEAAAEHLQAHDVVFAEAYQPDKSNFVIRDPDGLFIEVIQK